MGPEIRQALTCDTDEEEEEDEKDPETNQVRTTSFHFPRIVKHSLNPLSDFDTAAKEKHSSHPCNRQRFIWYLPPTQYRRARPRFSPVPGKLIGDTVYDQVT